MKRRRLLAAALALLTAPRAHTQGKIHRIGFLGVASASGYVRELDWIREGWRKFGYVEGRNLLVEYRWADGNPDRLREMAAELIALKVDVILTHATLGAVTAAKLTSTIPIVTADSADPVAAGLAASLARPGGNVTGSTSFVLEDAPKRLELLKEAVPRIQRVAVLASTTNRAVFDRNRKALDAGAASMKIELQVFMIREAFELPGVFNAMTKARIDAALINSEPLLNGQAATIASLAAVKRLPAAGYASFADAGGLFGYGANRPALYKRAAYFLDLIVKGARPGDIPFERAAKFDTVVNLKVAKSIGVTIPQAVLLRADRVIE